MCVIFGPKMEEYCPEMCFGHIRLLVALYQANLITLVKRHICGTQGVCVPNFVGVAPTLPVVLLFTNSLGRTHARTHGRTDTPQVKTYSPGGENNMTPGQYMKTRLH